MGRGSEQGQEARGQGGDPSLTLSSKPAFIPISSLALAARWAGISTLIPRLPMSWGSGNQNIHLGRV